MNTLVKTKNITLVLLSLCAFSCTVVVNDQYDLNKDVNNVPPFIFEGLVTNGNGPHFVKISRPTSLSVNTPDYVANASIIISDNRGNEEILVYQGNGKYVTSTLPGINDGRVYTMNATINGQVYTATSVMPDSLLPFGAIVSVPDPDEAGKYKIKLYTNVNVSHKEYYMFKFYKNDTLQNGADDIFIADNTQLNGNISGLEAPKNYKKGEYFKFGFYSVTREAYDFYNDIQAQTSNDGGVYSGPPANVKGNIPGAMGLFHAAFLLSDSTIVQ